MKFGNINMKETHFTPGGHPKTHPGEYRKKIQIHYVSDVTLIILNENLYEIWKHKYERNSLRPWGTPKDPPLRGMEKHFETPNLSDVTFIT